MIVLVAIGCGVKSNPGTSTAYQYGTDYCSESFVTDYNAIVRALNRAHTNADFDRVQSLINDFSSTYQGVSCKLDLNSTLTLVNATSRATEWSDLVSRRRSAANSSSTSASASSGSQPQVVSLPMQPTTPAAEAEPELNSPTTITLEVVDSYTFNLSANLGDSRIFQNGSSTSIYFGKDSLDFCFLKASHYADYKVGDQIQLTVSITDSTLGAANASGDFAMGCGKPAQSYSTYGTTWKLSDLRRIFKGIAKVNP